jgi:UDP-glucose:(heptosyl)LPS alpha-1,3-glucosyltransferase
MSPQPKPSSLPLRVAFIIDRFDPERGGAEAYLALLARFLRDRGHQVQVVCWRAVEGAGDAIRVRAPRWPRLLREIVFALRSARRAREFDVSLAIRHALHVDVYQPHGGSYVSAERAARECGAAWLRPWRALGHRVSPKHLWFRWLERQLLAGDVRVVALSDLVARELAPLMNPSHAAERIYNGVDLSRFQPRGEPGEPQRVAARLDWSAPRPFLLHVAHNPRLKGLHRAVLALADREVPAELQLVHVGRKRPEDALRLARRTGVSARVWHAGPSDAMASFYRTAAALVHPTYYDPCSLVTLEALACGLPVVTTARNGAAELIAGTGAGAVVASPDEVSDLARAIRCVLERGEQARREARAVAEAHPWQRHFEAMERVLENAAAARRGPP